MDGERLTRVIGQYGRQLSALMQRFWHWWSGQLLDMLPPQLRRRLLHPGQQLCIYVMQEQFQLQLLPDGQLQPLGDIPTAQQQQLQQQVTHTRLCLPDSEMLLTTLTLPAATADNLESVLRFEMDRHTPFTAEQVYFGFSVAPREKNSQHIQVTLLLASKERTDAYLADLAGRGLYPATLCHAEHSSAPSIALPVSRHASQGGSRRKSLSSALVLVMLFLLIAVPLYHRQNRIENLTTELDQPRQRAEQTAALKRELNALQDSRDFLSLKRAERIPTLSLLDELTRTLPDHTWLSRLELESGTIQIRGESANASELIGLLENTTWFSDVRFSSPITSNPATNKDRFMISARLSEGGAP